MFIASSKESVSSFLERGLLWQAEIDAQSSYPQSSYSQSPGPINLHGVRSSGARSSNVLPFGVEQFDQELPSGGLPYGALHEWAYQQHAVLPGDTTRSKNIAQQKNAVQSKNTVQQKNTAPPLMLFSYLAGRALRQKVVLDQSSKAVKHAHYIIWLGKECWPTPYILHKTVHDLSRCVFIDPPDKKLALWALEKIAASPATAVLITSALITDYCNSSTALSRRFALLAERSGALILLIRDPQDFKQSSSAKSRWLVTFAQSNSMNPCFQLDLVTWKGAQPRRRSWNLECRGSIECSGIECGGSEEISLHIPSELSIRPSATEASPHQGQALSALGSN